MGATRLFLLGILVYSVNFAHNQEEEQAGTPKVDIKEEEKPLLMGEGRGLALWLSPCRIARRHAAG